MLHSVYKYNQFVLCTFGIAWDKQSNWQGYLSISFFKFESCIFDIAANFLTIVLCTYQSPVNWTEINSSSLLSTE